MKTKSTQDQEFHHVGLEMGGPHAIAIGALDGGQLSDGHDRTGRHGAALLGSHYHAGPLRQEHSQGR